MSQRGRGRAELPSDGQLLVAWLIRAVLGCAIFGAVGLLAADEPVTLRNVVARGLLFGVLVATLHFCWSLYERDKARRSR